MTAGLFERAFELGLQLMPLAADSFVRASVSTHTNLIGMRLHDNEERVVVGNTEANQRRNSPFDGLEL